MTSKNLLDEIRSQEVRELAEKVFSEIPIESVRSVGNNSVVCSNGLAFCLISAEGGSAHHKIINYRDLLTVTADGEDTEKWTITFREGQYAHTLNLTAQSPEYASPLKLALQEVCKAKIRFEEAQSSANVQDKGRMEVLLNSLGLLVALLVIPFGFIGINYLGLEGIGVVSVIFLAIIVFLVGITSIASSRSTGKLSGCVMIFLGITFLVFSAAVPWWLPVFVFLAALSATRK